MRDVGEHDESGNGRRYRRPKRMRAHLELHEEAGNGDVPEVLDHPLVTSKPAELIECQPAFDAVIGHARKAGIFAFDTEFIGERTYFTRTCLVQIATSEQLAVIDPLANIDVGSLWRLLADPNVEKVVHAGTPDLELSIRHEAGSPQGVFDTQIVAGFCGIAYPASLRTVAESVTPAKLSAGLKFSQWDARPLSEMQIRYAADDVRYLLLLREALLARASELGNDAWALEECRRLETPEEYQANPHARRMKAEGAGKLSRRQRHVLRSLIDWREESAKSRDMSPRVFVPDEGLLSLAQDRPTTKSALGSAKGVPKSVKAELSEQVLAVIEKAGEDHLERAPKRRSLSETQKASVEKTCEAVIELAEARSIAMGIVATKKEIRQLASASLMGEDPGESRLLRGWRRDLLAPVIDDLGFA